jgi:hypothetical protein
MNDPDIIRASTERPMVDPCTHGSGAACQNGSTSKSALAANCVTALQSAPPAITEPGSPDQTGHDQKPTTVFNFIAA